MKHEVFKQVKYNLENIANDETRSDYRRIRALCELYFLHKNDNFSQAQYVRQIERIVHQDHTFGIDLSFGGDESDGHGV